MGAFVDQTGCQWWRVLGVPETPACANLRTLSDSERRAVSGFERLESDPWSEGVWLDPTTGAERHGSVASLLRWRQAPYADARALLEAELASLEASGHITMRDPGVIVSPDTALATLAARWGGLDTRFRDPTQFLVWPKRDGYCPQYPEQVPVDLPIPRNVRPVWITPKVLDPRQMSGDAVRQSCTRLASALQAIVSSTNANPALFPGFSYGMGYPQEIGGNNPPLDASVQELKARTGNYRDYWSRQLFKAYRPPSIVEDPERTTFRAQGFGNTYWENSLASRCRVYSNVGRWDGDHLPYVCADAIMDLNELLQLARFVLDLGPASIFYVTVQYHRVLWRLSRTRLGIRDNVSPVAYLAMLKREQDNRQKRGLANALAIASMGSMSMKAEDGTSDVIARASCATIASSVGLAGALSVAGITTGAATLGVGLAVAAVIAAVAIIVGFATTEPASLTPDQHPVLDDAGVPNDFQSNQHYWYQLGDILRARPVIDYRIAP